ncbi:MAG: hypothetical protein QOK39_403 [Acidimicrobiaceae bacterium]|nr:hypothetical protein [Acidimicrobiaceae bacterium]
MSGKRHKKGGRVTPKGTGRLGGPLGGLSNDERLALAGIFALLIKSARKELPFDADPLVVELWASQTWGIFAGQELVGADAEAILGGGMIDHAARKPSVEARRVLRALAAVAPAPYGDRAQAAAERLTAFPDPAWAELLADGVVPGEGWMWYDPVDDDGVSVMASFTYAGVAHSVGVYIDHNLSGLAKDAFVVPIPPSDVVATIASAGETIEYRQIDLAEVAARWRAAFEVTDMTWEAPVSDDLPVLRALVTSRLRTLPDGDAGPVRVEVDDEERELLLTAFLRSAGARELIRSGRADAGDIEMLAANIVSFCLDYVEGTPLRFSPVMVEMFCCDWAPRKIGADADAFAVLADVLREWIRFAGGRRGIPEEAISAALGAVDDHVAEMLEAAADPRSWGPAKSIVHAMLAKGVDMGDEAAVQEFIYRLNAEGGIDALV